MDKIALRVILICLIVLPSCNENIRRQMSDIELWKLGWRMIASSMEENYELASAQFDSLKTNSATIDKQFLVTGLLAKIETGENEEIEEILSTQESEILESLCASSIFSSYDSCKGYGEVKDEEVTNKELEVELIKMYIDDQAARGNVMAGLLIEYKIDSTNISQDDGVTVDKRNRDRLKEIIEAYGFPTRELVGEEAMQGVFFIIQHSDGEKEWQKSQLGNIEKAVKRGDIEGEKYAYLYDRIKVNSGEKQLYGTQFSNVDPVNGIVELAETEDIENLDKRRMEIGMMPIDMYKEFMLKNL